MVLTRRPGVGSLAVRVLQFVGADPNMTELRGLVCRAEDEPAVLRALQRYLLRPLAQHQGVAPQVLQLAEA